MTASTAFIGVGRGCLVGLCELAAGGLQEAMPFVSSLFSLMYIYI